MYYEASNYKPKIEALQKIKAVNSYPPLYCSKGGMTAQFEHTIGITEEGNEIFTLSKNNTSFPIKDV